MGRSLTLLKELQVEKDEPGSRLLTLVYNYLTRLGAVDQLSALAILRNFKDELLELGQALESGSLEAEASFIILDGRYITINGLQEAVGFFDTEEVETLDEIPDTPLIMTAISLNKLWVVG